MSSSLPAAAPPSVLVVDDEPAMRQLLEIMLRRAGYDVTLAPGTHAARLALLAAEHPFAVVISDLAMPDGGGLEVLAAAKERSVSTEVIVLTAHSSIDNAIEAMRSGAYDFVAKPFEPEELTQLVTKACDKRRLVEENALLRSQLIRQAPGTLIGRSRAMRSLFELMERIADTKTTVLITGESGTGKERVARELHERSPRRARPFLVINCAAVPEALMESELFGHEKGSFTGATAKRPGIFREAEGGTVLLDEVGELPPPLQVKLLRVLQERKVRPVGGAQELPIDVRLLAATNRNVEQDVAEGRFRQDLYYRLNVIRIEIPPLRTRKEDIAPIAERFVSGFAQEMGKDVRGFAADALTVLERYDFPGNVRELENAVERAVALARGRIITCADLPDDVLQAAHAPALELTHLPVAGCDLEQVLGTIERRLLLEALDRSGGVRKAAADLLGVSFRSLRYRLQKHGIDDEDAALAEAK